MLLADHLVVLDRGQVVQAGPPLDLYRRPATPFVASFLGEANLVEVERGRRGTASRRALPLGGSPCRTRSRRGRHPGAPRGPDRGPAGTTATVLRRAGARAATTAWCCALENGVEVLAHFPPESAPEPGSKVRIGLRSRKPHFLADG